MQPERTVLAIVPNWLGDVVMALPALAALRREGRLTAIGAAGLLDLLSDTGAIDDAIRFDRKGADRGPRGLWKVARTARERRPERVVVFPPSLRAAALAALIGVPSRRGFASGAVGWLLNERRRTPPRTIHLADAWLALVQDTSFARETGAIPAVGAGPRGRAQWNALREALQPSLTGPYFVVAPGATYGPTKRWPESAFIALAHRVASRRGWVPLVVGGHDPAETSLCLRVAAGSGGISVAGRTDLPALTALLGEAQAFVGNDSGPMHLAAACGTPTVGIFGSTSPAWTGPRGPRAASSGPFPVDCTPCFRRACPIGLPCLEKLSVDNVLQALDRVLHET